MLIHEEELLMLIEKSLRPEHVKRIIQSAPLEGSPAEEGRKLACFHVIVKMYGYSLEERVFIVKTYRITGSIMNCQRRFVEQFGGRNPASKRCIQLLVKKLETKGTLLDLHGGGRPEMSEKQCMT
jgi:hypothetical protein